MAYSKTNWVSGETPLSAGNMNNIEDGIELLDSNLGKLVTIADTTVNVASSGTGNTVLQTVTLPAGVYIFVTMVSFASNSNGMRGISISTNSSIQTPYYESKNAVSSASSCLSLTRIIHSEDPVTLRVIGRQTSGSNLSATTHSSIVRLK